MSNNYPTVEMITQKLQSYLSSREWQDEKMTDYKVGNENCCYYRYECAGVPVLFSVNVLPQSHTILLRSVLPFDTADDKLAALAVTTCYASRDLIEGTFELDEERRDVYYKMITPFEHDRLDENLFRYIVDVSARIVEETLPLFVKVNCGEINIADVLANEQ